ncbi:MAG: hypothetical protein K2Q06_12260 [Parvularculaceae bacterium]|nr:hypothetical protein [Parvularculaceae bacterium]
MIAIRLLIAVTVYTVILLEVYSGAIVGPWWWIIPGGLVISVVTAMGIFGDQLLNAAKRETKTPFVSTLWTWILVLSVSFGMAAFSYYFGRDILPGEMTKSEKMRSVLDSGQ